MSTVGFIFLVIGLVLIYLIFWKYEWFRTKVNHIASEEICPATSRIHKVTLIIGCILGAILAFTSSALKPYETIIPLIAAFLAIGVIAYFTFTGTNKRKGLLQGAYYVLTTFFLICASMFGVVIVIFLVLSYFILRIFLGGMLGSSVSSGKGSSWINFLLGGKDSSVESETTEEPVFEITDENGYTRKLTHIHGNVHKDDLGNYWEEGLGHTVTRKED